MEDEDIDPFPVLVRILVTYQHPDHPGIPHLAMHQFVDQGPDFEKSQFIYETYDSLTDASFEIWHDDVPQPVPVQTHDVTLNLQ